MQEPIGADSSLYYRTVASDVLAQLKSRGANQAEVVIAQSAGYSLDVRDGAVDTLQHERDVGIDITVYTNGRSANVSTTSMDEKSLSVAMRKVMSMVQLTEPDPYIGLPEVDMLSRDYPDLDLYHPWSLSPSEAIERLVHCDNILRDQDPRILPAEGISLTSYDSYRLYANSHDFIGDYRRSFHNIGCSAIVRDGDEMEAYDDDTSACCPSQLDDLEELAKMVAKGAIARLGSRSLPTQHCPVLFAPSVAKSLLRSFIRAISGSAQYRQSSFLSGQIGRSVFPDWVSIQQNPHQLAMPYSAPFDQEGVTTKDCIYVKNGELSSYVLDTYAAKKLNLASTGNSGGVYNLSINSSGQDFQTLCQLMGRGLVVTELMGQGTNIVSGNYSRGASGFWVENGEIQFPVSEVTIAGNLAEMFKQLVAVGTDHDCRGRIHSGSFLIESMTIAGS
ncbi:MAG: metalloprotease PmbA [Coxiellaceae bacterium]|nr:metalloprotease PmbA [Coxiellaceae bacterium]